MKKRKCIDNIKNCDYIISTEKQIEEDSDLKKLNKPIVKCSFVIEIAKKGKFISYFDFDNPNYIYNPNKKENNNNHIFKFETTTERPNYHAALKASGLLIELNDEEMSDYMKWIRSLNEEKDDESEESLSDEESEDYEKLDGITFN